MPADDWPLVGRDEELRLIVGTMATTKGASMVLAGAPGVGKSRLATEVLAVLRAQDWVTKEAVATQAAASIPFGPLVHLLPSQLPGVSPLDVLRLTGRALTEETGGSQLAICVDDAHLLDAASAALVHQLAVGRTASLLVTVQIGGRAPDPITALWKDRVADRIDLQPLSNAEVGRLLKEVLGGDVDGKTVHLLTRAIAGNLLFLHELVVSGLSSGLLSNAAGIWRWTGSVVPSAGLSELIDDRLTRLTPPQRRLLEAVALSEPLEADLLQKLAPAEVIRDVEEAGLLTVTESPRRLTVRVAHPLYAEVLKEKIPKLQAIATLRRLAEGLESMTTGRMDDLLRVTILRMRAGQELTPKAAMQSAQRALELGDFRLAEQLSRVAVQGGAGFPAHMVLGQALVNQNRKEAAENVLASVIAAKESEVAQLAELRAFNLYGLARLEEAEAVLQAAERAIRDIQFQDEITATRALILAIGSSAATGLQLAKKVIERRVTRRRTLTRAYVAAGYALSFSGRTEEALQLLDGALDSLDAGLDSVDDLRQLLLGTRWIALWLGGRLQEAEDLAWAGYQAALEDGREADRGHWAYRSGRRALFAGQIQLARHRFREAIAICRTADPHRVLVAALVELAQTAALAGDLSSARDTIEEAKAHPDGGLPQQKAWVGLSRAWVAACNGELATARGLAAEAADFYRRLGHSALEGLALQDVARLGDPASVSARLQEIALEADGLLLPAIARHVAALQFHDGAILGEVARAFEEIGSPLLAAEAAMQAALAYRQSGKMASARTWQLRARVLLSGCEGVRSPTLPRLDLAEVLTAREQEVAGLAARGLTSPQIAERLRISVRTVDNHLQQVFSKLEVRSRHDLLLVVSPYDAN